MILLLLCSGIALSQFYFISSGLPQVSHFILLGFAVLYTLPKMKHGIKTTSERKNAYKKILAFLLYTLLINSFYSSIEQNLIFLLDSIYYAFNIVVFISVSEYVSNNQSSRKIIDNVCISSLITLSVLGFLQIGRFYFGTRYNAFFNDPNQMSYWAVCVTLVHLVLNKKIAINAFCIILCISIVAYAQSRSGMLGLSFVFVGFFIRVFRENNLIGLSLIIISVFTVGVAYTSFMKKNEDFADRVEHTDVNHQLEMRGYTRPLNNPEYLLFGSGKGMDNRFNTNHEIHSNWIGLLFYYGSIGLSIFIYFYWKVVSRLDIDSLIMSISPFVYGISTYGLRTPIFWIMLSIVLVVVSSKEKINES